MLAGLAGNRVIEWDLDSIIQELMMALVGYTGDIFVDSSTKDPRCSEVEHPDRCTVGLAPDVVLAEDVNKEELLRLVQLSFHYKQIKQFIQQEQQPAVGKRSKYRCALCTGIDEVLCLYEDEVVLLQDRLLQDRLLQGGLAKGLPGITYELADLQRLLVHVHYMVYELRRRLSTDLAEEQAAAASTTTTSNSSSKAAAAPPGYDHSYPGLPVLDGTAGGMPAVISTLVVREQFCGARLLHWLHERKAHGDQLLRACTQRLMWHVNQVFFNHLTLWMVHGLLLDSDNEFLIKPSALAEGTGGDAAAAAGEADTDTVRDSSSSSNGTQAAKPCRPPTDSMDTAVMSEQDTYRDFHSAFVVDNLQLPPGLSTHTASSIEFVGRAVRLLKSAPSAAKLREMQDAWGSYSQQQQQGGMMGLGCVGASLPQQLLPYGDAMAYAAALRLLQNEPEYSPSAMERTVEAIRADVASRVWHLVVVDSRLTDHLTALKDYMLLGKGDFYQCFLTDAAKLLQDKADKGPRRGFAAPWQSAANKSSAADDPHLAFFNVLVDPAVAERDMKELRDGTLPHGPGSISSSSAALGLGDSQPLQVADCIRIEAQLPWPLGVLITGHDLERYNRVFALLLKVKRVQLDLEAAWQELGRLCGRSSGNSPSPGTKDLVTLRNHMGHLIGNLQVYLHLDVIETNFDTMIHKVAAAQDFAEVAAAHEAFLRNVTSQTLLGRTMVLQMHHVFALARRLCALVKRAGTHGLDLDAVKAMTGEFEPVMRNLCISMKSKSLKQHDRAPYLQQLYERINYNGYISKNQYSASKGGP